MRGRVLWVSTSMDTAGGVATYVRTVAATPLWGEWRIRHIVTHRDGPVLRKMIAFAHGGMQFTAAVLVRRPALVHLHSSSRGSFARKSLLAWTAVALRIPVVIHIHGSDFHEFYRRCPRPARGYIRWTLSHADRVVALGETWAERMRLIAPSSTVVVIPNAVRKADVRRPASGTVRVLFLGRVDEAKGVFTLLDAWSSVIDGVPYPVRLTIAGGGDLARAHDHARRRGVSDSVELCGRVDRRSADLLLADSQILVLPSRNEGQPMAVLEAMARGLCVVASSVGGVPDLIDDRCGVLVARDDVAQLATALRRVVRDEALRVRLGRAARERVGDEFDVDVVWRRLDTLYTELTT